MKTIDRSECTPELDDELRESFEELVNETHDVVSICGYDYDPARVLREVDPVAYYQEFLAWIDGERGNESIPGGRWRCGVCGKCWELEVEADWCCDDND